MKRICQRLEHLGLCAQDLAFEEQHAAWIHGMYALGVPIEDVGRHSWLQTNDEQQSLTSWSKWFAFASKERSGNPSDSS